MISVAVAFMWLTLCISGEMAKFDVDSARTLSSPWALVNLGVEDRLA